MRLSHNDTGVSHFFRDNTSTWSQVWKTGTDRPDGAYSWIGHSKATPGDYSSCYLTENISSQKCTNLISAQRRQVWSVLCCYVIWRQGFRVLPPITVSPGDRLFIALDIIWGSNLQMTRKFARKFVSPYCPVPVRLVEDLFLEAHLKYVADVVQGQSKMVLHFSHVSCIIITIIVERRCIVIDHATTWGTKCKPMVYKLTTTTKKKKKSLVAVFFRWSPANHVSYQTTSWKILHGFLSFCWRQSWQFVWLVKWPTEVAESARIFSPLLTR